MHEGSSGFGAATPLRDASVSPRLVAGTHVCVWNSFLEMWTGGFSVAEVLDSGYRLRRLSDGYTFDHAVPADRIIVERRRVQLPGFVQTSIDRRQSVTDDETPSTAEPPRLFD